LYPKLLEKHIKSAETNMFGGAQDVEFTFEAPVGQYELHFFMQQNGGEEISSHDVRVIITKTDSDITRFIVPHKDISSSTGHQTRWSNSQNSEYPRLISSHSLRPSKTKGLYGVPGLIEFVFEAPIGEYPLEFRTAAAWDPSDFQTSFFHVVITK
jgi:hypothetical protein